MYEQGLICFGDENLKHFNMVLFQNNCMFPLFLG